MQSVLIDTDIAIEFLRGNESIKDSIISLWNNDTCYMSLLSVYELYAGMHDKEKPVTEAFIDACHITDLTLDICNKGGELYRFYRKKGLTLTTVDCLIFATAKKYDMKIATNNLKHYPDKKIIVKL